MAQNPSRSRKHSVPAGDEDDVMELKLVGDGVAHGPAEVQQQDSAVVVEDDDDNDNNMM